jgi:hypothetical protein
MAKLPTIICPGCGKEVISEQFTPNARGGAHHARNYHNCLRRCAPCGFGFSNSNTDKINQLTIIYRNPFWNLPAFVAKGHELALERAINIANRLSKREKFASSQSEDHVTWTVFRYLQINSGLRSIMAKIGVDFASLSISEPTLLLWGVPVANDDTVGKSVYCKLEAISDAIGEDPTRRSEPDVILDFGGSGLVLIEVKVKSPNDTKKGDYEGWAKYISSTEAFTDPEKAKSSGLYELVRNWRIGCDMAVGRPVVLINLGFSKLFDNDCRVPLQNFRESLRQDPMRRFHEVTWEVFLGTISNKPEWFNRYLQERGLVRL